MVINGIWLVVLTTMVIFEIYLLSKYVSEKNSVFIENRFSSFVNGTLLYLFITFISFSPFLWIKINILYLVVVFWIKEGISFLFLLTRNQNYINKTLLKDFFFLIVGALIVTLVWNYGISKLVNPVMEAKKTEFDSSFVIGDVFAEITNSSIAHVHKWTMNFLVSIIAVGSITAMMKEFSYSVNIWGKFASLLIAMMAMILFSFKLPLWQNAETFIALHIILICIRIILFSRRRYGFVFAIASITAFTFGDHLRIGLWAIALVTMIIYTLMKKPQNSLFWVMLISPLLIIEALNTYQVSGVLAFVLVGISVFLYIFMLSLQGVKPLKVINAFFEKNRVITPILIGSIIFIASFIVIGTENIKWNELSTVKNSMIYPLSDNDIYKWINLSISILIMIAIGIYIFTKLIKKDNLTRVDFILLITVLMSMIIYNPVIDAMLSTSFFGDSTQYTSTLIFLPLSIIVLNEPLKWIKQK